MARPRTPTNVLKLRGGLENRPSRAKLREDEPENKNKVGDPPDTLSEEELSAFNEIIRLSIDGVLGEADTLAIEQASVLLVKCRTRGASAAEQNQFFKYLSQFGMTPADRSKISVPKQKSKNPFDD